MSNDAAAYYLYLAQQDREKARLFRRFGYLASAAYIDKRAKAYETRADHESKKAPQVNYGASRLLIGEDDSDLHTASGLAVDGSENPNIAESPDESS